MKETKTVAKDGETTLKRAMEIVQAAFPVFLSVWGKAQEEIKENEQIAEELTKFEEARYEVMMAGLDVEKRIEKSKEFKAHIGKYHCFFPHIPFQKPSINFYFLSF